MSCEFAIRTLRKRAHLTQAGLATKIGIRSPSLVAMWESGERSPRSETLPKIAAALNCSIAELFASDLNDSQNQSDRS